MGSLSAHPAYVALIADADSIALLDEVVVHPYLNKIGTLNKMAVVGGHMLSVEEANRMAGAFEDPARQVSAFAGVSTSLHDNGIIVHGSSPASMVWHIDGVEVPSPNHYTEYAGRGQGIVAALHSQCLENSDFFTGALTAEYANALSGAMDMYLRCGNANHSRYAFQVGTMGLEVNAEGPLRTGSKASYLFNYRYALTTLARQLNLMKLEGEQFDLQDLNFKLNVPTQHAGNFALWAVGIADNSWIDFDTYDISNYEGIYDQSDQRYRQKTWMTGLNHDLNFAHHWHLQTRLLYAFGDAYNREFYNTVDTDAVTGQLSWGDQEYLYTRLRKIQRQYTGQCTLSRNWHRKGETRLGIHLSLLDFNLSLRTANQQPIFSPLPAEPSFQANSRAWKWSAFVSHAWYVTPEVLLNVGLTSQGLTINHTSTLEPRLSSRWMVSANDELACGYALQSKIEPIDIYYCSRANKTLALAKSHQLLLSWTHWFSPVLVMKTEAFWMHSYDVPVADVDAFIASNPTELECMYFNPIETPYFGYNYCTQTQLCNEGEMRHYGLDASIEQYMHHGWFWLMNASVFKAEVQGQKSGWVRSMYDHRFVIKAVGGKEWQWGNQRQHTLNVSGKYAIQGSNCYTPVDAERSRMLALQNYPMAVRNYGTDQGWGFGYGENAYSEQPDAVHILDLSLSYEWKKKSIAHRFSCDLINVLQSKTPFMAYYSLRDNRPVIWKAVFATPYIYYRVSF